MCFPFQTSWPIGLVKHIANQVLVPTLCSNYQPCMRCMFQVFCSHLELLIQQLYAVSEKMELLAAPTVDIDSVKSSLAKYQVRAFSSSLLLVQKLVVSFNSDNLI